MLLLLLNYVHKKNIYTVTVSDLNILLRKLYKNKNENYLKIIYLMRT